jgi:two-component system, LytTR family, response regulator LytT
MLKVVIIEDERLAANRLVVLLKSITPFMEVLAVLPSIRTAVAWLQQHQPPDLLLVDIHLEDGISFSIFQQVTCLAPVIFTTAFEETLLPQIDIPNMGWLNKPIHREELADAMQQALGWSF